MDYALYALGAVIVAGAAWLLLVAFRGTGIAVPPRPGARPARTREEALQCLAELQALDDETIAAPCHTRLLEPDGEALATVVVWHGFTNCPHQFHEVAELLRDAGLRVLLARMPRHGVADVLTHELADLTTAELTEFTDLCLDCAAGFGDRVWVVGLSAGAAIAAWAAATRGEVRRAVLAAPFVAPKAIPMPVVRLLIRFHRLIPRIYLWWDLRKKADLGESPYVYPGFPLPGMVPFLHLGEALYDGHVEAGHRLRRVVLISNPGDFAIRRDVARRFVFSTFEEHADVVAEASIDGALGWWHDFVDPHGPHHGSPEQVVQVFLSALGVASDPSALGTLTAPLPAPDPATEAA